MRDSLVAWTGRMGIAIFPVMFTIITLLFGNTIAGAVGEGYSTMLYFSVILSTELVIVFPFQSEHDSPGNRTINVLLLMLMLGFWISFVVARVISNGLPLGQTPWSVVVLGVSSVPFATLTLKRHWDWVNLMDVERNIERTNRKQITELEKTKGGKVKVGKKDVEF